MKKRTRFALYLLDMSGRGHTPKHDEFRETYENHHLLTGHVHTYISVSHSEGANEAAATPSWYCFVPRREGGPGEMIKTQKWFDRNINLFFSILMVIYTKNKLVFTSMSSSWIQSKTIGHIVRSHTYDTIMGGRLNSSGPEWIWTDQDWTWTRAWQLRYGNCTLNVKYRVLRSRWTFMLWQRDSGIWSLSDDGSSRPGMGCRRRDPRLLHCSQ